MKSIFIDGQSGTTGQKIHSLLSALSNISLITLDDPKDETSRQEAMNSSDLTILCLPDDESKKAVTLLHPNNTHTKILDCSSAFRMASGWVYGFPELSTEQAFNIASSQFVSNPGCYATGAIAALNPLLKTNPQYHYRGEIYSSLIQTHCFHPTITGLSGYSGGGKSMISAFENGLIPPAITAYSLDQFHKHESEIQIHTGISSCSLQPMIIPIFKGMIIMTSIDRSQLLFRPNAQNVTEILKEYYDAIPNGSVRFLPDESLCSTSNITAHNLPFDTSKNGGLDDKVYLSVFGHHASSKITLVSMLDNLGKGAATQALQNIKLMLDLS